MTHKVSKIIRSLTVMILIFNMNLCIVYANNNNIDLDKKKEYPYSAECIIMVKFKTHKDNECWYICTGQLVDKNKILTCGHEFKFSREKLTSNLNEIDQNETRSSNIYFKTRDELYEIEVQYHKDIVKQKESERQERIDSYLSIQDKYILEKEGVREKSSATDEYLAIIAESNKRLEGEQPYQDGPVRVAFTSKELVEKAIEKENKAIKTVDEQIEEELAKELNYKLAWEFPEFAGIEVDFMFDAENQSTSSTDLYTILKENIVMNQEYDFINPENDLAIIKTDKNIGYTYGWFGLLSSLEENKQYSLAGYPTENNNTVFKNLSLTSRTGSFDNNIGIKNDSLYYYQLNTAQGFSGAGLRVKSKYGNDYRIISIHHGKDENGKAIGVRMTKDKIDWVINN